MSKLTDVIGSEVFEILRDLFWTRSGMIWEGIRRKSSAQTCPALVDPDNLKAINR